MKPHAPALGRILITGARIAERVREMGEEIRRDYNGEALQFVVVAEGGQIFGAQLRQALGPEVDVQTAVLSASSYGSGTASSGHVRVCGSERLDVAGRHVLLVDDIVDTGNTARTLLELLGRLGAGSIRFAALLSKPDRRVADVQVDYVGFRIPDEFVVGYGMDCDGAFRDLPDIRVVAASS